MREYHGGSKKDCVSREYMRWAAIKQRCENKNHRSYKNYGGRGIGICSVWRNSFSKFLSDMGRIPQSNMTIDRKDVNGNYCKENCRWATNSEQGLNRRKKSKATSKHIGVSWSKYHRKWHARICINYKDVHLGYFNSEIDASSAHEKEVDRLKKEHTK